MRIDLSTIDAALADTPITVLVLDKQHRLVAVVPKRSKLGQDCPIEPPPSLSVLAVALGDETLAADVQMAVRSQSPHERRVQLTTGKHRRRILPSAAEAENPGGVTIVLEKMRADRPVGERVGLALDRFWFDALHDLKTPLSAIVLWQQLLEPELDRLTSTGQTGLNHIMQSVREVSAALAERSRVVRLLSRNAEFRFDTASWRDCVRRAVDRARPLAREKQLELHVTTTPDGEDVFDVDQVSWVLDVLLDNAVKFTPTGGTIEVALRRRAGRITVTVTDSGVGLSAEAVSRVFEPFESGSEADADFGSGVNLAAARYMVEAHGGSLTVVSAGQDLGCVFRLRLPAKGAGSPVTGA